MQCHPSGPSWDCGASTPRSLPGGPDEQRACELHLAVLRAAPHAAGAGPRLAGGALRRGDAEHAHRLEPEAQALTAIGRADVETGEVAHALEPVADRVAVGVEPRGGAGDVAVALQERLERLHEVGLVLRVV